MAGQMIDSKGVAEYLASVRGMNITPSFSDKNAYVATGPIDPYASFNPIIDHPGAAQLAATEAEKDKKAKEELLASLKAPEEYQSVDEILNAKNVVQNNIYSGVQKRSKELREEYGLPALEATRDMYLKVGFGNNPEAQKVNQRIADINNVINSRIAIVDGQVVGLESANFNDQRVLLQQLDIREKRLAKEEATATQHGNTDYNRITDIKTRAMVAKEISPQAIKALETVRGAEIPGEEIASWKPATVKIVDRMSNAPAGSLGVDVGDTAIADEQARRIVREKAEKTLSEPDLDEFKQLDAKWSATADVAASKVVLPKSEELAYKDPKDKEARLEQLRREAKVNAVEYEKAKFKETRLTVELFDPTTLGLDAKDAAIAKSIYTWLGQSYGSGTRLADIPWWGFTRAKNEMITNLSASASSSSIEAVDILRVYNKMLSTVGARYAERYGKISGTMVTDTDPILAKFR